MKGMVAARAAPAERDAARIGDRLASSALLLWTTTVFLRLLQLATTTILARILSPSDYGLVAIATMIVGFLDLLSNLQVGNAIMKTTNLTQDHLDTAFTINLIRGALSALAMLVIARPAAIYMHDPRLQNILYVLAVPALLGGIHNPHFFLFARNLNFNQDSKRDALASVLGSAVGITVALLFRSYWALVASSVASGLMWTAFSYWRVPASPRLSFAKTAELLAFGKWLIFINILDYVNSKIDYLLIGKRIGTGTLGAYNVGNVLTTTATYDVVGSLSKALIPAFSMLSSDLQRLRTSYRELQSITLALALPIGVGMSAVAANVILVLVGKKWELAIPVVTFLAPLVALQTMNSSIESLALSLNKGGLIFWRTALFLVVRGVLMFTGFYLAGFLGIIYARVISGTTALLYNLFLVSKIIGGGALEPVIASWRSFAAVGLMWCALTQLPFPALSSLSAYQLAAWLFAKIFLGAVIYIGTHTMLWMAAGWPNGAEQRLVQQGRRAFAKITKKSFLTNRGDEI